MKKSEIRERLLSSNSVILSKTTRMYMFIKIKLWALLELVAAIARKHGIRVKKYLWLKDYCNKFEGERCFIVATGPSLTTEDLELIKGEYSFGMNSLCMSQNITDWIPTFFGIQDQNVYAKVRGYLDTYPCKNIFIGSTVAYDHKVSERYKLFPVHSRYHLFEGDYQFKNFARFSDDCYSVVYDGFTITYSLIQLAVYFGFKEIYLLGADCNYEIGKPHHFIEHGSEDKNILLAKERMFVSYEVAKKYADTHDVRIFNATRGGKLEIFPRVRLEDIVLQER